MFTGKGTEPKCLNALQRHHTHVQISYFSNYSKFRSDIQRFPFKEVSRRGGGGGVGRMEGEEGGGEGEEEEEEGGGRGGGGGGRKGGGRRGGPTHR